MMNAIVAEYIYILQRADFVTTGQNIYKLGRTVQNCTKRIQNYPKGSILFLQINTRDSIIVEKNLLNLFEELYTKRKDYGLEYFQGDIENMKLTIFNYVNKYNININNINNKMPSNMTIGFGKYRGESYSDIVKKDRDYIRWLLAQTWFKDSAYVSSLL